MLCGLSLSVDGIVGIVLLIGIVKKNGIMMVDFAIEARRAGANAHDAIRRACLLRFRPIMMTTAAAMLGALPLALGTGIGSSCAARWVSPSSAACCCRSWSRCTPRR